jgi:hypothetical protein
MILPNSFQNDSAESFNANESSSLIQFHFGLKEAQNLFSIKVIMHWKWKKKNPCFYTTHRKLPLN